MLWVLCIFGVFCHAAAAPPIDNTESTKPNGMVTTITSYGYVAETHHVTTEDGYILGVYRIPYVRYGSSGNDSRPVVFCMHGLYGQSQNYIIREPELAFGFNLADAGFDVWFGNARGNVHSRSHVTLDPDNPEESAQFFNFSWEEIAIYDIPAMIDYILKFTGREKLHYIGHSQGGTTFLVLGSMRPEYNDKMASVNLLAGVGYQEYFPHEELKFAAQWTDLIYAYGLSMGLSEFSQDVLDMIAEGLYPGPQKYRKSDLCFGDIKYKHICELVGARYFMREVDQSELEVGGGALKQIAHYGQNIRDKIFRRFDYGTIENEEKYGLTTPPLYDLSLITSNVVMHYTVGDNLLDERDVLAMAEVMPNTVVRKVARDSFEHSDFVIADDAKELVTDYIIESIYNVHNGGSEDGDDTEDPVEENPDPNPPETDPETEPEPVPDSAVHGSLNLVLKSYLLLCVIYFII